MLIMNKRMYEINKFRMGPGAPKAPGAPPPPPEPGGAAQMVKDRNIAKSKYGRPQTILGGSTMGGSSPNETAKTLLGG